MLIVITGPGKAVNTRCLHSSTTSSPAGCIDIVPGEFGYLILFREGDAVPARAVPPEPVPRTAGPLQLVRISGAVPSGWLAPPLF